MTIDELVTELESKTIGDHDLDFLIHETVGWIDLDEAGWERGGIRTNCEWPYYSTSLDSAVTLLKDHNYILYMQDMHDGYLGAHVFLFAPSKPYISDMKLWGEAHLHGEDCVSLRPLAVCSAALKSLKKRFV